MAVIKTTFSIRVQGSKSTQDNSQTIFQRANLHKAYNLPEEVSAITAQVVTSLYQQIAKEYYTKYNKYSGVSVELKISKVEIKWT